MRHFLISLFVLTFSYASAEKPAEPQVIVPAVAAGAEGLIGFWQTHDDKTGELKGLIEFVADGATFRGLLRETYRKDAKLLCAACPGDKKDKPYKGLELVWDVRSLGKNEWGEGHIMDPENGKTYRVKLTLQKEGAELKVRGYLGLTLFGRTQTWTRFKKPS